MNANVVTPGPLSMYRKEVLDEIGGFSTKGFSEDVDVTIRIIRKGYQVAFVEKSVSETNMPETIKGFLCQRARFVRGAINIFKKHLRINTAMIDLYTLPLLVFMYMQSVIMGSFTLYQIISGYLQYFVAHGIYFSKEVLLFFFNWLSLFGFAQWVWSVISGATPLTLITAVGIASSLLSYPLFFYALIKYDKITFWTIIPLLFMLPFWLIIMGVHLFTLPELFRKNQRNIWKKYN
jgi:cellulose synthase/poly-beta-1,6-N-acetylglucosamine synthase-like glycosyltransferase